MIANEILPMKGVDVGGGGSTIRPSARTSFCHIYYCVIELYQLVWMSMRIDQELSLLLRQ
jgi:hypothetical protein